MYVHVVHANVRLTMEVKIAERMQKPGEHVQTVERLRRVFKNEGAKKDDILWALNNLLKQGKLTRSSLPLPFVYTWKVQECSKTEETKAKELTLEEKRDIHLDSLQRIIDLCKQRKKFVNRIYVTPELDTESEFLKFKDELKEAVTVVEPLV